MNKRTSILCVLALLLLSAVLNYAIHYNYPLPTHSDEYDHLAIIQEMDNTGKHVWYDPYIVQQRHAQRNLEINYDVFLYVFYALTGLELRYLPMLLPIIFSFLLSVSAFVLVHFLTRRDLAAFFAGIFVLFLSSNIAFLGYWFMVPMAVGIAAVPLLAFAFLRSFHSWAYAFLLYLFLIALTLTHAVYTVSLLPAFLLFLLLSPRETLRPPNLLKLLLGTAILLGLTTFFVQWNLGNFLETLFLIAYMMVWPYGKHTVEYPLNEYLGSLMWLLALAGLLYLALPAFNRRFPAFFERFRVLQSTRKTVHHQKLLILLPLVLLAVRVYADYSGVCLLGPCRRTMPGLAVILLMLAAIGFYSFIAFLNKLLVGVAERPYRILRVAIFLLVLAFLFHQLATDPFRYASDEAKGLYHNIEVEEQPALAWLKDYTEPSTVIFALPWTAKAVYLLAERKVVDTGAARLGSGLASLKDIVNFFLVDCVGKEAALARYPADFIYAGKGYVDCRNLDLIANHGGYFTYVPNH